MPDHFLLLVSSSPIKQVRKLIKVYKSFKQKRHIAVLLTDLPPEAPSIDTLYKKTIASSRYCQAFFEHCLWGSLLTIFHGNGKGDQ